jgi:hypothetical protein
MHPPVSPDQPRRAPLTPALKVYLILDELIMAGEMEETSKKVT